MKKVFIYLVLFIFALLFIFITGNLIKNHKILKTNFDYKNEIILKCPSYEEWNNNEIIAKNSGCASGGTDYYSPLQFEIALDFAKKLKYVYRTKNMSMYAEILPYPNVYIYNYKNKDFIEIKTKSDFLKLDKNIIFNKNIFENISDSKLFWNWKGFSIGNGSICFFCI